VLGLGFGFAVGVGGVIGGGILRTPGSALNHVPLAWLVMLLWAFAGVHALLGANIVAEVMTSLPKSGGLFNVAGRAFGSFGALLVGWTDWLVNTASVAALCIATAEFLAIMFPAVLPYVSRVGATIAVVVIAVNWFGVREGKIAQIVTSAVKGALLVGMIALILVFGHPASPAPQLAGRGVTLIGVVIAYQLIIAAYGGWSSPAYFAEEDECPGRNIPRALFFSIVAVSAVYLTMNVALLYALPINTMRTANLPVSLAVATVFGRSSLVIVSAIAVVTVIGCANASMMLATRILHGLARDRYIPKSVSRVNIGGTPDVALGLSGVLAVLLALSGRFETVFLMTGALVVFVNALIDGAFFKLRWSEPGLPRPYHAFAYPWLPALALLLDSALVIAFLSADIRSAVFMIAAVALCVPFALVATRRRTREALAPIS
jgi:APA family basic amino acid/polyamine antiporter